MHIAAASSFRCHYRRTVPGQEPLALYVQVRARTADEAAQRAEAAIGHQIDRVEPAPAASPIPTALEA
ncbi:MAG: hypothetical protein KBC94_07770 [Pseudacidovorax sp.]|uniref:hypothetical protein n=1 Tax=Pseudacidovorax sp. TaxID=1934311 RepID=UPI001B6E0378|nr:hypothetical protein [Pseudacidovorax sp.]MBP6894305.1 hypothetical protein [Pseudacidovorax sp.]